MSTNCVDDLSKLNIDAPGLQMGDYEVCRLLTPYVRTCLNALGQPAQSTARIEVRAEYVRACVDTQPHSYFIQVALPRGLHDACVDFSCGPVRPFPASRADAPAFEIFEVRYSVTWA